MIILIILIIALIIIIKFKHSNYRMQDDNITFYQGMLGSGKSAIVTRRSVVSRFSRQFRNRIIRPLVNFLLWFIPIFNIFRLIKKLLKKEYKVKMEEITEEIYSSFPIRQKTIFDKEVYWSKVIDADIFTWHYKIKEDKPIIAVDELEYLCPSETKKADPELRYGIAWLRHALSPTMFCASQNLDGVNVEFRRRINNVYNLNNCKRCFFPFGIWFSKVQVHHALISENFTNIYQDKPEDREENWYRFKFPKNNYNSRYGRNMYYLSDEEVHKIAVNYKELLKAMNLKCGDRWRSINYEFNK